MCHCQIKLSQQRWSYVQYALDTGRAGHSSFLYSILCPMAAFPRHLQCDHDLECSQRILKGQKRRREKKREDEKMEVMMTRDGRMREY